MDSSGYDSRRGLWFGFMVILAISLVGVLRPGAPWWSRVGAGILVIIWTGFW